MFKRRRVGCEVCVNNGLEITEIFVRSATAYFTPSSATEVAELGIQPARIIAKHA